MFSPQVESVQKSTHVFMESVCSPTRQVYEVGTIFDLIYFFSQEHVRALNEMEKNVI